ncbi:MAG TPA: hypothetical protein VNS32_19275 [Flavisolibacter sp.]|nr:hypothetical protein [Flavisolibacter sp.]
MQQETEITDVPIQRIKSDAEFDRTFKPKGAIAFFILLITVGFIIWFGIYFLMLDRV